MLSVFLLLLSSPLFLFIAAVYVDISITTLNDLNWMFINDVVNSCKKEIFLKSDITTGEG